MKQKTLFTIFILFAALCAQAQITKGNWLVGGEAIFSTSNTESRAIGREKYEISIIRLEIEPNIGYFFSDKWVGGLQAGFFLSDINGGDSNSTFNIGPFIRHYFLDTEKMINILGQAKYNVDIFNSNDNFTRSTYTITGGPSLFFNSSIALEFLLNYQYGQRRTDNTFSKNTSFFLSIGFQIHLTK